jgi:hypothetical protein
MGLYACGYSPADFNFDGFVDYFDSQIIDNNVSAPPQPESYERQL